MMTSPAAPPEILQIRKYSNRRFYDTTHSRHLTLEAIRNLVKKGHQIRVIDGSGSDITTKVLAQIILDLDGPKIELFPAAFLAEIIRVNDLLLKGFYEKFFHQAHRAFLDYQRLMESQLKHGGGLPSMFPMAAWGHAMMDPWKSGPAGDGDKAHESGKVSAMLQELQRQVASLQSQLGNAGASTAKIPRARRAKRKTRVGGTGTVSGHG
jgi:polyhydroxyalkanoate synthesis repressor PhaR